MGHSVFLPWPSPKSNAGKVSGTRRSGIIIAATAWTAHPPVNSATGQSCGTRTLVLCPRRQGAVELAARRDGQLGEHLAQVVLHRAGTDEQPRTDL